MDENFADLYDPKQGRHSVLPSLLANLSLLQTFVRTRNREALEDIAPPSSSRVWASGQSLAMPGSPSSQQSMRS